MEVVVALDDRTSPDDTRRVRALADQVHLWTSEGYCEKAYPFVQQCSGDFVFMIADDEEPSPLCWDLAQDAAVPLRYGLPVVPIHDGKIWGADLGFQERLVWRKGWTWVGAFEGHSTSGTPTVHLSGNPGAVIWHYLLDAPREEREEKAQRYTVFSERFHDQYGTLPGNRRRVIWEEHPELFQPIPAALVDQLPKE